MSEDPIGFAGGDVNLHRYVDNSSTNRVDPDGLGNLCGIDSYSSCPEKLVAPISAYGSLDAAENRIDRWLKEYNTPSMRAATPSEIARKHKLERVKERLESFWDPHVRHLYIQFRFGDLGMGYFGPNGLAWDALDTIDRNNARPLIIRTRSRSR